MTEDELSLGLLLNAGPQGHSGPWLIGMGTIERSRSLKVTGPGCADLTRERGGRRLREPGVGRVHVGVEAVQGVDNDQAPAVPVVLIDREVVGVVGEWMFRALDMCGFRASRLSDGLGSRSLMASLGVEFEAAQREAEARALGAEMYVHAVRISPETVDAVAAVLATRRKCLTPCRRQAVSCVRPGRLRNLKVAVAITPLGEGRFRRP